MPLRTPTETVTARDVLIAGSDLYHTRPAEFDFATNHNRYPLGLRGYTLVELEGEGVIAVAAARVLGLFGTQGQSGIWLPEQNDSIKFLDEEPDRDTMRNFMGVSLAAIRHGIHQRLSEN